MHHCSFSSTLSLALESVSSAYLRRTFQLWLVYGMHTEIVQNVDGFT
jgi:hypothetical protein